MAKRKTGIIKILQTFCILCFLISGLITVIGTGTDDVTKDISRKEGLDNFEMDLPPINVTSAPVEGGALLYKALDDPPSCNTTTINEVIDGIDWTNVDIDLPEDAKIKITDIELEELRVRYTDASWNPGEGNPVIICTVESNDLDISEEMEIFPGDMPGYKEIFLSNAAKAAFINYFEDRDLEFSYCASCSSDSAVTDFTANIIVQVNSAVTAKITL